MPARMGEVRRRFETLLAPSASSDALSSEGNPVLSAQNTAGETFALKLLKPPSRAHAPGDKTPDPETLRMVMSSRELAFAEEYRSMLAVSFLRGFPRVYGFGIASGDRADSERSSSDGWERPAIVMEWIEGPTLREALPHLPARTYVDASGALRSSVLPEIAVSLGVAMLDILLGAGELDCTFLHRDLSPRNIIVRTSVTKLSEQIASSTFDPRIVDLGSSSVLRTNERGITLTHDIWRFGTIEYAAPEMLTRDVPEVSRLRYSATVDTYAICSMLYEMVCDRTPFELGRRPNSSPYLIKMREHPEVPVWLDGDARALVRLLVRGLSADQSMRYTPSELREALLSWPNEGESPVSRARRGRRRSLLSALAGAAREWAHERQG